MSDSQYPRWPVNSEPLNTFGRFKLLFPISKKEFVPILFQFPKTIVLNFSLHSKNHHSCFIPISKIYRSWYVPKFIILDPSNFKNVLLFHSKMNRSFMALQKSLWFVYKQHITYVEKVTQKSPFHTFYSISYYYIVMFL